MPLTQAQKSQVLKVINDTAPKRGAQTYPEECYRFPELCNRELVRMTADGHEFSFYIVTAKNRIPNCPVHINIHGGGFFYPHEENDTMFSAYVADKLQGIVIDIDYTTSSTAPWPVAFNQCYAVAQYAFKHCAEWDADEKSVSMGGYSAGASLTAGIALKAAQTGDFQLCLQVLGYPLLDSYTHPLYKADGYSRTLPWERDVAFGDLYLDGDLENMLNPYASPLYAEDALIAKLPRTLICSAASCNFRFENEEYARKLAAQGVEVTFKRFPGTNHGFIPHFTPGWRDACDLIIRTIKSASGDRQGVM